MRSTFELSSTHFTCVQQNDKKADEINANHLFLQISCISFLLFYYGNILVRVIFGKSIFSAATNVGKCGKVRVHVKDCFIVQSDIHYGGSWCCLFYVNTY